MHLTPRSVHTAFNVPPGNSPSPLGKQFTGSLPACSAEYSGCSFKTPSRLEPEPYNVFNIVSTTTAIVPWPPPSCSSTRPIQGYDLFSQAPQKCGKKLLVVCVLQSPLPPPLQYVEYSQWKWIVNWLEVREDKHMFGRVKVVKLKPPWPCTFGMPMDTVVLGSHSLTLIDVGLRPVCLQLEQLIMAKLAALMYTSTGTTTLPHQFSSGNIILIRTAIAHFDMAQHLHCEGPQGSFGLALLEWTPSIAGVYSWAISGSVFAGDPDVPMYLWLQCSSGQSWFPGKVLCQHSDCEVAFLVGGVA